MHVEPVNSIQFSIADMAICSSALRRCADGANSMEEAGHRIVRLLYDGLSGGSDRRRACVLVRLFKTHPYAGLPAELQDFARLLVASEPEPSMKCLMLVSTVGDRPEWCSRHLSVRHKAIPLPSTEVVECFPMISNLVRQLGLQLHKIVQPDPRCLTDLSLKTYNVFHVPQAIGSPYIPAQQDFVIPHGIHSCLGFGGVFPDGDLFAVVAFARLGTTPDTASMFKSLSISVKTALLPFEQKVFS
jgi:hypothetical protein